MAEIEKYKIKIYSKKGKLLFCFKEIDFYKARKVQFVFQGQEVTLTVFNLTTNKKVEGWV